MLFGSPHQNHPTNGFRANNNRRGAQYPACLNQTPCFSLLLVKLASSGAAALPQCHSLCTGLLGQGVIWGHFWWHWAVRSALLLGMFGPPFSAPCTWRHPAHAPSGDLLFAGQPHLVVQAALGVACASPAACPMAHAKSCLPALHRLWLGFQSNWHLVCECRTDIPVHLRY